MGALVLGPHLTGRSASGPTGSAGVHERRVVRHAGSVRRRRQTSARRRFSQVRAQCQRAIELESVTRSPHHVEAVT